MTRTAPRKSAARREVIVQAAMELFSAKAYEDVSVDDVCERASVAHGLISYYFGGKRGLFAAAVRQAWAELVDYEQPRADETSSAARVRGYVRRHLDYVARRPERFTTLMRTGHADAGVLEIVMSAREAAVTDLVSRLGCPTDPPALLRLAIQGWVGHLDALTLHWLGRTDIGVEEVTELAVHSLIAAVRAADGERYGPEEELAALDQVSALRSASSPEGLAG